MLRTARLIASTLFVLALVAGPFAGIIAERGPAGDPDGLPGAERGPAKDPDGAAELVLPGALDRGPAKDPNGLPRAA